MTVTNPRKQAFFIKTKQSAAAHVCVNKTPLFNSFTCGSLNGVKFGNAFVVSSESNVLSNNSKDLLTGPLEVFDPSLQEKQASRTVNVWMMQEPRTTHSCDQ
jgi:hypothetical protein